MRRNHNLCFRLNYDEKIKKIRLIPLVLLTLVENIFKHGNLNVSADEAVINIYLDEDFFYINTYNLVSTNSAETGSHTGLKNIEQRLRFSYGADLVFDYRVDSTNHFYLQLNIPLPKLVASVG